MILSSGMAAILTSIFSIMKKGDHAIFQNELYGGTHHAIVNELPRYGMEYTMVESSDPKNFEKAIRPGNAD